MKIMAENIAARCVARCQRSGHALSPKARIACEDCIKAQVNEEIDSLASQIGAVTHGWKQE